MEEVYVIVPFIIAFIIVFLGPKLKRIFQRHQIEHKL